jgi:hypothetical protein
MFMFVLPSADWEIIAGWKKRAESPLEDNLARRQVQVVPGQETFLYNWCLSQTGIESAWGGSL